MLKYNRKDTVLRWMCNAVVYVCILYVLLPMVILRENYIWPIHDGLDQYPAFYKLFREYHIINPLTKLPIMNGMPAFYLWVTSNLYDVINCSVDYIYAQILVRIISIAIGYPSMYYLLCNIFGEANDKEKNIFKLIAIAYVITPLAAIRSIAFSSVPLLVLIFLMLIKKPNLDPRTFLLLLYGGLSSFQTALAFLIGFWFVATVIICIIEKKANPNLIWGCICLIVSCAVFNISILLIAVSGETNRMLLEYSGDFLTAFKNYFLDAQYHAPTLHKYILLPVALLGTIIAGIRILRSKNKKQELSENAPIYVTIAIGWGASISLCVLAALRDSGFKVGVGLIDGFGWERVQALNRIVWFLMFTAVLLLFCRVYRRRIFLIISYALVGLQLCCIGVIDTTYNDVRSNVIARITNQQDDASITFREFYSVQQFDAIKESLSYTGEGVVAYGFHPSVLIYNGFLTLDGYASVIPMEQHRWFRTIIAPELEVNAWARNYYDTWGGRMYIYGALSFHPTRQIELNAVDCNINIKEFIKCGGRYIISRAEILNSDSLGINLVNVFSADNSIYKIWVYDAYVLSD